MPTRFRRVLGVVAIAAITLHTAFWGGTATRAATAAIDPFSVICHSDGNADTPDHTPVTPASAPSHACDHCNLCGTTSAPAAASADATIQCFPARSLHQLEPAFTISKAGLDVSLKGARGPPVFA